MHAAPPRIRRPVLLGALAAGAALAMLSACLGLMGLAAARAAAGTQSADLAAKP